MRCQFCDKEYIPAEEEGEIHSFMKWRANLYGYCSWLCESKDNEKDNELINLAAAIDELDLNYARHVRKLKGLR